MQRQTDTNKGKVSYLRLNGVPLMVLAIEKCFHSDSPREIRKSSSNEGMRVGGILIKILLRIQGDVILHRRAQNGYG